MENLQIIAPAMTKPQATQRLALTATRRYKELIIMESKGVK